KVSTADVVAQMNLPERTWLVRMTGDGKKCMYPSDGSIRILNTDSGIELNSVPTYVPILGGFSVSRDGTRAIGVQEGALYAWDLTARPRKAPLAFGGVAAPDLANAGIPRGITMDA